MTIIPADDFSSFPTTEFDEETTKEVDSTTTTEVDSTTTREVDPTTTTEVDSTTAEVNSRAAIEVDSSTTEPGSNEINEETTTIRSVDYDKELVDVTLDDFFYETVDTTHEVVESTTNKEPVLRDTSVVLDLKPKVSRVLIIKRPLATTTTESMITVSRAKETDSDFEDVKVIFIGAVVKAIIQWKTSLMVLLIVVLIMLLSYHRRRIIRLEKEIVEKNLGSPSQSCSYRQSANAYTPTHFSNRQTLNSKLRYCLSSSDSESDSKSYSNGYAPNYNSPLHIYDSISESYSENIYAEIPSRKQSIVSIENESMVAQAASVSSCELCRDQSKSENY